MPVDPGAYRRQVHEQALDAAQAMLAERGWDKVRFGDVASAIGVSRPTLYAAFGSKEGLGEALVVRETARFVEGIREVLDAHTDDAERAVRGAVRYTLKEADRSPVLHAVLTSTGEAALLPLLTTRSGPVLRTATTVMVAWFCEHFPEVDRGEVEEGVDAIVRLTVSHLVLPADAPSRTPDRLARLAVRYLALATSAGS